MEGMSNEYYQKNKEKIAKRSKEYYLRKKAEKINCVQNLEIKP